MTIDEQRYTFTMQLYDGPTLTMSGNSERMPDIVEDFKKFLLGCGFHPENVETINCDGGNTTQNDGSYTYEL